MADRNKIVYLWDDPPFRKIFDPDLNPGIDPRMIKCTDKNTQIKYETLDGSIYTITPYSLTRRKGFSHSQKYQGEYEYCKDDFLFMEWYKPFAVLNPDVDINALRTSDQETLLRYSEGGEMFDITPYHIISFLHVNFSLRKPRICAHDNQKLKDWLKEYSDLNPGIDPDKVTMSDYKTKLFYRPRGSDKIFSITPNGLSRKKDWYAPPANSGAVLAKDIPGFLEWLELNKDLNPDIDIASLTVGSNTRLNYRSRDGTIRSVSVICLCMRKDIFFQPSTPVHCSEDPNFMEWYEEYRWLNPDIDISTLTVTRTVKLVYLFNGEQKEITTFDLFRRKDMLSQIRSTIRGSPLFWTYCIEEDCRTVNSYSKTYNKILFKMRCPEGHEYNQSPERFYHYANLGRDPCPYCDERVRLIEGVNDAYSVDPEIKLYYSEDNKKPVHMVGAYNAKSDFKFECPYCGHKFTKRMRNIIGKHPKCPKCKDKGSDIPQNTEDYMPEGIPFLVIQDDLRPKTRKQ